MVGIGDLAAAFAEDGTPIRKAGRQQTTGRVLDETARQVLTEVGIPEQLGYEIFFSDIDRKFLTKGESAQQRGRSEATEVDDLFVIGAGPNAGTILLDGVTGYVISWRDGGARRVNSGLDKFVEFLRLIQLAINDFEDREWPDEERTEDYVRDFLVRLGEVDTEALPEALDYWEVILKSLFLLARE